MKINNSIKRNRYLYRELKLIRKQEYILEVNLSNVRYAITINKILEVHRAKLLEKKDKFKREMLVMGIDIDKMIQDVTARRFLLRL